MIDGPHDEQPDDLLSEGDDTWRHPKTLGLAALALAVLSLLGAQALRGSSYTLLISHESVDPTQNRNLLLGGAFLTALFALVPVLLAKLGLDRLVADDGPWAGHVLRAALLLGGLSFAVHVVRALLAVAAGDQVGFTVLY
jgi:hypothetical protein